MKKTLLEIINESKKFISEELSFEEIKWLLLEELSLKDYELITKKNDLFEKRSMTHVNLKFVPETHF